MNDDPAPPPAPPDGGDPRTPLFPLGSVLFPGGLLPLRIFEVRYLDMISRCHKAGRPFGVVALSEGREVQQPSAGGGNAYAREAFHPVGTLAVIDVLERPQPGLLMVRCTGTRRFRVVRSEKLKHGLWVGDIDIVEPDAEVRVPDDLAAVRDALKQLLARIEAAADDASQLPVQRPYRFDDCGWVANRFGELLPLKPEARQRLMALDNPLLRLELVADALEQMGFEAAGDASSSSA